MPDVRSAAFVTLMHASYAAPEIQSAFLTALGDEETRIRVLAAKALIQWQIPEVVAVLARQLGEYQAEVKTVSVFPKPVGRLKSFHRQNLFRPTDVLSVIAAMSHVRQSWEMETSVGPATAGTPERKAIDPREATAADLHTSSGWRSTPQRQFPEQRDEGRLSMRKAPDVPVLLKEMLYDDDRDVILLAAHALVVRRGVDGFSDVFKRMASGPAPQELVLYAGAEVLLRKEKRFAPQLYQYLFHQDREVRTAIASQLKDLKDERIVEALLEHSRIPNPMKRRRIVDALAVFGGKRELKRLREMADDPNNNVSRAARALLSPQRESEEETSDGG